MHNIVIGIPTYKRPIMLKKLLLNIKECNISNSSVKNINIIVIDNDSERTAEGTVNDLIAHFTGSIRLNYYNYPVKGLSNVRNKLFDQAFDLNPDFIVCIDDDEFPTTDWLNQLLTTITESAADIVLGPVIPVFEHNVSPYISYWFKYKNLNNHQKIDFFWTGNFIISSKFLLKNKIKFDDRFNFTGSEDSHFGVTALKAGATILWSKDAVVYETIPEKRAKLFWLIKRSYNGAVTYCHILKLERNYLELINKSMISVIYFAGGLLALIFLLFPFRWKYWGVLKISESMGGIAGLFGIKFHEYAKDR
jgi:succinoglycan biosynthesis protein ExoM